MNWGVGKKGEFSLAWDEQLPVTQHKRGRLLLGLLSALGDFSGRFLLGWWVWEGGLPGWEGAGVRKRQLLQQPQ